MQMMYCGGLRLPLAGRKPLRAFAAWNCRWTDSKQRRRDATLLVGVLPPS